MDGSPPPARNGMVPGTTGHGDQDLSSPPKKNAPRTLRMERPGRGRGKRLSKAKKFYHTETMADGLPHCLESSSPKGSRVRFAPSPPTLLLAEDLLYELYADAHQGAPEKVPERMEGEAEASVGQRKWAVPDVWLSEGFRSRSCRSILKIRSQCLVVGEEAKGSRA